VDEPVFTGDQVEKGRADGVGCPRWRPVKLFVGEVGSCCIGNPARDRELPAIVLFGVHRPLHALAIVATEHQKLGAIL